MSGSEEQFQELLGHLVAHANKALTKISQTPPLSLALHSDGGVEVGVGIADSAGELGSVLNAMERSLKTKVQGGEIVATCIAFPDRMGEACTALLENDENYCLKVTIPVTDTPTRCLSIDAMQIEDGSIRIFPVVGDS
jgi:hypothetical protein